MANDKRDEPRDSEKSATDEMAERYAGGAHVKPVTGDATQSEPTGLPPGVHDSNKSPVSPDREEDVNVSR
jgi:hypothetical protein